MSNEDGKLPIVIKFRSPLATIEMYEGGGGVRPPTSSLRSTEGGGRGRNRFPIQFTSGVSPPHPRVWWQTAQLSRPPPTTTTMAMPLATLLSYLVVLVSGVLISNYIHLMYRAQHFYAEHFTSGGEQSHRIGERGAM